MSDLGFWVLLGFGCFLGAGIIAWGEYELRRIRDREPPFDEVVEEKMPATPPVLDGAIEDLHMKYTLLAEQNPRLAGQMKYAEQVARHGR